MQIEAYKEKILNKKCLYETQKTAFFVKIYYRPKTFTTKLRGRSFDSAGDLAVYVESDYFRATIIIFIQLQHKPFILRYRLFESDGCRIIYLFS